MSGSACMVGCGYPSGQGPTDYAVLSASALHHMPRLGIPTAERTRHMLTWSPNMLVEPASTRRCHSHPTS